MNDFTNIFDSEELFKTLGKNFTQPFLPKVCKVKFDVVERSISIPRGEELPPSFPLFVEIPEGIEEDLSEFGEEIIESNSGSLLPQGPIGIEKSKPVGPFFSKTPKKQRDKREREEARREIGGDKDREYEFREVVVEKNGQARQAGSETREGEFIRRFKKRAEESLFVYLKGVLNRRFLTSHFHRETCDFLQECPPFRKLVLMPREHAKTAIVSGGLPTHILIQPKESNIYFPGMEGSECRILLSGETERMAKKNLRVVKSIFEENKVFRAFWPERCWIDSRAREWSGESIIIPRKQEWPDPTIKAVGVGGAITGARPNVMIKDDLVSFKAMNSELVMQEAIDWHIASRALLDTYEVESGLQSLEFIIGTRWSVFDLYSYIIDKDPSVEVNEEKFHKIIDDGKILWPEKYTKEDIEQLRLEHGSMFYLLYLNSSADPSLTDFSMEDLREFKIIDGMICFEEDGRDIFLREKSEKLRGIGEVSPGKMEKGRVLDLNVLANLKKGGFGCRVRA